MDILSLEGHLEGQTLYRVFVGKKSLRGGLLSHLSDESTLLLCSIESKSCLIRYVSDSSSYRRLCLVMQAA